MSHSANTVPTCFRDALISGRSWAGVGSGDTRCVFSWNWHCPLLAHGGKMHLRRTYGDTAASALSLLCHHPKASCPGNEGCGKPGAAGGDAMGDVSSWMGLLSGLLVGDGHGKSYYRAQHTTNCGFCGHCCCRQIPNGEAAPSPNEGML